ncbi:hypothetical protein D3C78_1006920 [compost metagenome]
MRLGFEHFGIAGVGRPLIIQGVDQATVRHQLGRFAMADFRFIAPHIISLGLVGLLVFVTLGAGTDDQFQRIADLQAQRRVQAILLAGVGAVVAPEIMVGLIRAQWR